MKVRKPMLDKKTRSKEFQELIVDLIETDYFDNAQKVKEFEKEFDAYCDEMAFKAERLGDFLQTQNFLPTEMDEAKENQAMETTMLVDEFFLG